MASLARRAVAAAVGAAETAVHSFTTSEPPQTIVLALDASEMAEFAVNWYISRIHRHGNRLIFAHCVELPELKLHQARSAHTSPGMLTNMLSEEEIKTKALEDKIKSLLKEKGLVGTLRTGAGKPGEVICRIAEEEGADMIVTGTRGMGKVRRTVLGSVSDYLVHHAHCPVIVCRHPDTAKKHRPPCSSSSASSSSPRSPPADGSSRGTRPASRSQSMNADGEH